MPQLILLRHGQSEWNLANRFTGWVDVDLSEQGRNEARQAGILMKAEGLKPDMVFTSVLKRAIRTLWIALDEMDMMWLPVQRAWELNERHYGALQGLNKAEMAEKHGEDQVHIWRRSYDVPPPPLDEDDAMNPIKDPRYAGIDPKNLPLTESLKLTLDRVLPFWEAEIVPYLKQNKAVLIAAHGNSLRALVKHLDGVSDDEITGLNIPTGIPLVYDLNDDLSVNNSRYLGDAEAAAKAAAAVAAQSKAG